MLPMLANLPLHGFLVGFGLPFIISLAFPVAIRTVIPVHTKPARWIQNCPPFSVFMLSAFPIAMGILTVLLVNLHLAGFDLFEIQFYGSKAMLAGSISALLIMFCFATIVVFRDFMDRPVAPYILRGQKAAEAFGLEKILRDTAKAGVTNNRKPRPNRQKSAGADHSATIKRYQELVQLDTVSALLSDGGLVAAAYLTIGWIGTMGCVFYFWVAGVLVLSNRQLPPGTVGKLATIFILLITWFPMRIHMDWYQNYFHNPKWLLRSLGFWTGVFLAIGSLTVISLTTQRPEAITIACAILNVVVLLFVGILGMFKPEWLNAIADMLQTMPFLYFLAVYLIFLFVTIVIGFRVLNG